jgi:2,4-dienoyl-CoA reductase-like NADH-dependent reductase (Old Yellow Enzyme family)
MPNTWHMVHLGSRAVGGAGLVLFEAAAVCPEGRISPSDLGLWSDGQADALRAIVDCIHGQGAVAGIQLAHAGRKGSTQVPWVGRAEVAAPDGGWETMAPSALRFSAGYPLPREMTQLDIQHVISRFGASARLARAAGFQVIELHMGHGYLLHQFLSPLSNRRQDDYGGSFENRIRLAVDVVRAVRAEWPEQLPLFVRLSATDWLDGGWDIEQSVQLAKVFRTVGVDLIDCSSGSIAPDSRGPQAPGFQVPFAAAIRTQAGIPTAAVGLITQARQAEDILAQGQADMVLLARQMLVDPYWPLRAQAELEGVASHWPVQYERAVNPNAKR